VLDTLWNDERVTPLETHGRLHAVDIAQRDVKNSVNHQKEFIRMVMCMPHVLSLDLCDSHVVIIDALHDPRAVDLRERRKRVSQIDRLARQRLYARGIRASSACATASRTGSRAIRSRMSWKKPRTISRSASPRDIPRAMQ
jgi:hypothetical protein